MSFACLFEGLDCVEFAVGTIGTGCRVGSSCGWMSSSCWMRSGHGWMRGNRTWVRSNRTWMRVGRS